MYDTVHVLNMYMCMCGGGKDEIYVYAHVPLFHITFYYHHSIQYELMGLYCCVRLLLIFFSSEAHLVAAAAALLFTLYDVCRNGFVIASVVIGPR